jgi:hypothetical protein
MEKVGDADRDGGAGSFDRGEGGMIVHNVIGEQNLVAAAAAEIQRGEIIQRTRRGNGGEQQVVFAIPETVLVRRSGFRLRGRSGRAGLIFRSIGSGLPGQRNQKKIFSARGFTATIGRKIRRGGKHGPGWITMVIAARLGLRQGIAGRTRRTVCQSSDKKYDNEI